MRKFTIVALLAAALGFGLLQAPAAQAAVAPLKATQEVKMQVKAKAGAPVFNRKGKAIRNRHGKVVRLRYKAVRTYTHVTRIKGREYRRPAGKRYLVRSAALRPLVKSPVVRVPTPTVPAPSEVPVGPYNADAKTLVFGDSISALDTSWWSHVRDLAQTNFSVSAIGGTGLISGGYTNAPFASRLDRVAQHRPDFIIVAGGRNDWGFGVNQPRTTDEEIRTGVAAYLAELATTAEANGVPADRVYVMTPWGSADPVNRDRIVPVIATASTARGFHSVSLPTIPESLTTDGTHPTVEGSVWLAEQFLRSSGYAQSLARWVP